MANKGSYPNTYGKPNKALPDILGPLNVDFEGDKLAPSNSMDEGSDYAFGKGDRDPDGFIPAGVRGK